MSGSDKSQRELPNTLQTLSSRLAEASIDFEREYLPDDETIGEHYLRVNFPNGRQDRSLLIDSRRAEKFLNVEIADLLFLGDFDAFHDRGQDIIEARIGPTDPYRRVYPWTLPGAEVVASSQEVEMDADELEPPASLRSAPSSWRLRVTREAQSLELSPISELGSAILPGPSNSRYFSLKIWGSQARTHDAALDFLRSVGGAFLFELEVLYGVHFEIRRRRPRSRRFSQSASSAAPRYPRNRYALEALELYNYARSASGLPLLAYLAYYQSLEYHFPVFAKEELLKSLRTALLDPRFDPTDDGSVNRLIRLASPGSRGAVAEKDQLRATIRGCVEREELEEFLHSSTAVTEHFCAKKQAIRGMNPIRSQGEQTDLRDQVSDRIYSIRCRVVHTKEDGGSAGDDLLLPTSREAASLGADIELIRLIAQRALTARASRS